MQRPYNIYRWGVLFKIFGITHLYYKFDLAKTRTDRRKAHL